MDPRNNLFPSQEKIARPISHFNRNNNLKKPISRKENDKPFILRVPKKKKEDKILIKRILISNQNQNQNQIEPIPKIQFKRKYTEDNKNNNFPKFKITDGLTKSFKFENLNINNNQMGISKNIFIKKISHELTNENKVKLHGKKKLVLKITNELPLISNQSKNIKPTFLNFNNFQNLIFPKEKKKLKLKLKSENNFEIIKSYYKCENPNLEIRKSMEDYSYTNINFINDKNHKMSLFAIFDGHNGIEVSEYLYNNFDGVLKKNLERNNFKIEESISESFIEIDLLLQKSKKFKMTGSTASVILIDNNIIYCANVGDSTCYYLLKNEIIEMTTQHNVKNKKEVERIKKKEGLIFNGKVFGCLSITRTFGDFDFKDGGVIVNPTLSKFHISNDSKFIILASDGLWDVISKDDAYNFSLNAKGSMDFCQLLVNEAIIRETTDNVSCIVIQF